MKLKKSFALVLKPLFSIGNILLNNFIKRREKVKHKASLYYRKYLLIKEQD
jgi:hypothetical protein